MGQGSGVEGNIFLGVSPSLTVRSDTIIGSSNDLGAFKLQVAGDSYFNPTAYTTAVGGVTVGRSGNFVGVDTETAIDLRVAPSLTLTEPGSGTFTWNGASIDMSGISVTAGGGTTALNALRLAGVSDADAGTVRGLLIDDISATAATEVAVRIGSGWDQAIDANGTLISLAELGVLDAGIELADLTTQGTATDEFCLTSETGGGALLAWQACGGSSVSFGTDNQIPVTNSGANNFDYSSDFTFDDSTNQFSIGYGSAANGVALRVRNSDNSAETATFENNGAFASISVNNSGTGQVAYLFKRGGTTRWQFGMDFAANGTNDWYVYDQTNATPMIYANGSGGLNLGTGAFSTPPVTITSGGAFIFNESGADRDFRIEGDTNANLFFTDASTDRIGIGTNTPGFLVDIVQDSVYQMRFEGTEHDDAHGYKLGRSNVDGLFRLTATQSGANGFIFGSPDGEFLNLGLSEVVFNETGASRDLRVEGDTNANLFVLDASVDRIGIGDATPDYLFDIANTGTDGDIFSLTDSDGECLHNPESGSETVSCSSDARLKADIVDTGSALSYFSDFRIRDYTVIASGDTMTGVIAQEMLTAHPELVTQGADGMYSVQLPNQWKVIKAIQELDIAVAPLSDFKHAAQVAIDDLALGGAEAQRALERLQTNTVSVGLDLAALQSAVAGLQTRIEGLDVAVTSLADSQTGLDARLQQVEAALSAQAFDSLASVTAGTLAVSGDSAFSGSSAFDGLSFFNDDALFAGMVRFDAGAEFVLPPLFGKDTAGFALIKEGDRRVRIAFEREYPVAPIVQTSVTFETEDGIDDDAAQLFFDAAVQSIVTEKNTAGFTIVLNMPAPRDIRFSWIALAVKDPAMFESAFEGLVIDEISEEALPQHEAGVSPAETPAPPAADEPAEEQQTAPVEEETPGGSGEGGAEESALPAEAPVTDFSPQPSETNG